MWVYSTTTATSAQATRANTTESRSTSYSQSFADSALTARSSYWSSEATTVLMGPYVTRYQTQSGYARSEWSTSSDGGTGSSLNSSSRAATEESGFTRSFTERTTNDNGATTFSTAESTRTRSIDSYRGGTTTETAGVASEVTTTETTTRSIVSTAAGPTTTTTAENITRTTTSTAASTVTRTTYSTVASAAIVGPVSLVPVSLAEASEQAWEVTVTAAESAGYPSHVGTTFSSRVGTLAMDTTELGVASSSTFTSTHDALSTAAATSTLTTTATTTSGDTFRPWQGSYPASATSTRVATLMTTQTTTITADSYYPVTATITCNFGQYSDPLSAVSTWQTATAVVTININPTSTTTAVWHRLWSSTTFTHRARETPLHATSSSTSSEAGGTGTESYEATVTNTSTATNTNTATDTLTNTSTLSSTATNTNTATDTDTDTITQTITATSTSSTLDACVFTTTTLITASASYLVGITSNSDFDSTDHVPPLHTISHLHSEAYTATATSSSTSSSTFTTTAEETYTTTGTATATSTFTTTAEETYTTTVETSRVTGDSTYQSETAEQGIAWTFLRPFSAVSLNGAAAWSAHGMRPRQGWRQPEALASTDGLCFDLSIIGGIGAMYLPQVATQDDSAGAVTPILHTDGVRYSSGASEYTASYRASNSSIYLTSGVRTSYTETQRHGSASTVTVTREILSATETSAVGFANNGSSTWYHAEITTAESRASRIGGMPARSEYRQAMHDGPGVVHETTQSGGTSTSSATAWLTSARSASMSTQGRARPTRTESVWSVTQQETSWRHGFFESGAGLPARSSGSTSAPILTVSKYPNI